MSMNAKYNAKSWVTPGKSILIYGRLAVILAQKSLCFTSSLALFQVC